jgi:predicted RNase H-like nuclease (RuvC/YqgF family)
VQVKCPKCKSVHDVPEPPWALGRRMRRAVVSVLISSVFAGGLIARAWIIQRGETKAARHDAEAAAAAAGMFRERAMRLGKVERALEEKAAEAEVLGQEREGYALAAALLRAEREEGAGGRTIGRTERALLAAKGRIESLEQDKERLQAQLDEQKTLPSGTAPLLREIDRLRRLIDAQAREIEDLCRQVPARQPSRTYANPLPPEAYGDTR